MDFRGPHPKNWFKGTLKFDQSNPSHVDFLIEGTGFERFIGKTSLCIFKLEREKLMLSAGEPGKTERPTSFEPSGKFRVFTLKKKAPKSPLEGTWKGYEINRPDNQCQLMVSGNRIFFKGSHSMDWYKGTAKFDKSNPAYVDVVITNTGVKQYLGKTSLALFKVEGDKMILVGGEPGVDPRPTSFVPSGNFRAFALKKVKPTLEGTWQGYDLKHPSNKYKLVIAGNKIDMKGTHPMDWYKGTLKFDKANPGHVDVMILETGLDQYVGKSTLGLFKIEGGKLYITAGEPGKEDRPTSFEGNEKFRSFVFERK